MQLYNSFEYLMNSFGNIEIVKLIRIRRERLTMIMIVLTSLEDICFIYLCIMYYVLYIIFLDFYIVFNMVEWKYNRLLIIIYFNY